MSDRFKSEETKSTLTNGQKITLWFIILWYCYMWVQELRGTMLLSTWGSLPIIGLCQGALLWALFALVKYPEKRHALLAALRDPNGRHFLSRLGYGALAFLTVLHWYIVLRSPDVLRPMQLRTILLLSALVFAYKYWELRGK